MSAENESVARENKARAAFDEYRRRMDAQAMGGPPGQGAPFPPMMPGWMPPPPGVGGFPAAAPWPPPGPVAFGTGSPGWGPPPGFTAHGPMPPPMAGQGSGPGGRTGSVMQAIGSLVRLGVDALNVGVAGGIQFVQGLVGPGAYGEMPCMAYGWPYQGHYGRPCGYDCCPPGYPDWGCNPSVRGCY